MRSRLIGKNNISKIFSGDYSGVNNINEHYFAQSNDAWETNFGAATAVNLGFYDHRYGSNIGDIKAYIVDSIGVIITPLSGAVDGDAIYSVSGDAGNQWNDIDLSNITIPPQSYRVVWHHFSGTSVRGDYALDQIQVGGNTYSFESGDDGFVTSSEIDTTDSATAFSNSISVPTSTRSVAGQWSRDSGGTRSGGTGPSSGYDGSFYVYTETSGNSSTNFWLFTPLIT